VDTDRLVSYATQLGSDCPFFLINRPCLGQGRGERLEPLPLDLSAWTILLVHPGVHISTAAAFARCHPDESSPSLGRLIVQPVSQWRNTVINDFETALFPEYPILQAVKQILYDRGALYASMTGSGSCLFGIFEKGKAPADGWDPRYEVIPISAK
jgi:4-diphosphocytidyl-2-C-methyl-D-erythritol kinase